MRSALTLLVRYETLNMAEPEIHTEHMQNALIREMTTLVEGNLDDRGVVFPVQQFVVIAARAGD